MRTGHGSDHLVGGCQDKHPPGRHPPADTPWKDTPSGSHPSIPHPLYHTPPSIPHINPPTVNRIAQACENITFPATWSVTNDENLKRN